MKNLLSIVLGLLCSLYLQAQITIPSTTLPALGDQLRYSWAYDQATFGMVTAPGFDLEWDFSALTADESLVEEYLLPSEGVHAARFPNANLMTRNAAGEERYYVVSPSGLRLQGWTENQLFGEPFTVVYDLTREGRIPNGGLNERFTPLNFFDTYAQSAGILKGYTFSELPKPIRDALLLAGLTTTDSVRLRASYSQFYSVNANGTTIIPGPGMPSEYPVLRMATTVYRETRFDGHVIPLGWLDITDLTMQYFPASIAGLGIDTSGAHTFFNDVTKEEIARITLDSEGRPHHVRFKNNFAPACFDPGVTLNGDPIAAGEYLATQTIESAGRIAEGSTVAFAAGNLISLLSGFHAEAGSFFSARIAECPANLSLSTAAVGQDASMAATPIHIAEENTFPKRINAEAQLSFYPNPIRTSARIEYALPATGPVWLGVLDANGRLMQLLEQTAWKESGAYFLDWTPTGNTSGLFYLLLKTDQGILSKKMVLISSF